MKSRQTVRGSIIMFWRVFLNFLRPFLFKAIYWLTIEFHRRKICLPIGSEDLCPNQPMGFWGLFSQRHLLSLRSESASSQYLVIIPSGNSKKWDDCIVFFSCLSQFSIFQLQDRLKRYKHSNSSNVEHVTGGIFELFWPSSLAVIGFRVLSSEIAQNEDARQGKRRRFPRSCSC